MGSQKLPHILLFDCCGVCHDKPIPKPRIRQQLCTSKAQADELHIQLSVILSRAFQELVPERRVVSLPRVAYDAPEFFPAIHGYSLPSLRVVFQS